MDDLSVSLVLALQLEDVDTLLRGSKGKNPEGRQSDVDIALAAYREELQKNEMIFTDRRMGKSISEAVQRDGSIIATARLEEHTAIRDREVACHLGGVQRPKRIALEDFAEIDADDDVVRRLCTLNICDINDYNDNDDERDNKASSSKTSRGGSKALGSKKQCVACQEDRPIFDILAAPCTHNYCRDCVSGLFEAATTDESLFPPRCCRQTIPLTSVKTFLSAALIQRFKAKAIELKSPDRTYCFRPTCSAFIPKERISGDVATCPDCLQTTCTVCKSASHAGECPNDTALQRLLHTATANGWQRCYACRRLVELELGCNHMTCVCRAQFCYVCGQRWKYCPCPQWNEDRLLARATQLVRRGNPLNPANEQQHIQRAADNLRERHECTHESWRYVRGPHACEECHHELPQYIFECTQCRIQACNRCRRNRL